MTKEREFDDQVRRLQEQSKAELTDKFNELKNYVGRLDPVKLVAQLSLTHLSIPEGEFLGDANEAFQWSRWIEFLTGYLLTQPVPKEAETHIDGTHLEKVETLLESYFSNLIGYQLSSTALKEGVDINIERIIMSAKIYSLYVRGDAYPHMLYKMANDLYEEHESWFKDKLGFTIGEAIHFLESVKEEYDRRINDGRVETREKAKVQIDEFIKKGEIPSDERDRAELSYACYLFFGKADERFSFTASESASITGLSQDVCQRILDRLSQSFGYRNPHFKDTFTDALSAPWDYNTLYERPIIAYEDRHIIPVFSIVPTAVFSTFHYDLIGDAPYCDTYNEARGKWLEQRTATAFQRIFPTDEVFLNPDYPNGEELTDVLVLHDRKIFIIQCKAKQLTYEAKIGESYEKLKDDLEKSIKNSFEQAKRARDYLNSSTSSIIVIKDRGEIEIDMEQVTDVFLVSVTAGTYQNLVTRLANINKALDLISDDQYPWAVNIFDLETITELIESPSVFIHYAKQRLAVEQTNFDLTADEIDILGFYFEQGLYFDTEEFAGFQGVSLSGFSEDIDKYMFEKHELGENPPKPQQEMPEGFLEYLRAIENLDSAYKTDCAMRLLDLNYKTRELLVSTIEQVKQKTKEDQQLHSFATATKEGGLGFAFIAMHASGKLDKLFDQLAAYSVLKKYATKSKEWVGLGWDANSRNLIDVIFFASFDWFEDPVIEEQARNYLKPGTRIEGPFQ